MTRQPVLRASTTAFALGLWAQPAPAGTPTDPWYVGASAGATNISVYNPDVFAGGWEDGPDHSSWSLQGGYRASHRFAVELSALSAANLSWTGTIGSHRSDSHFDVEATAVSAVGVFSFGSIYEVHGKLGLAHYDLAGTQVLESTFDSVWSPAIVSSQPIVESRRGFLLGARAGANLTPRWSVWLDYQSFYIDSSFVGAFADYDDSTIDTLSLLVSYRFGGAREQPAGE